MVPSRIPVLIGVGQYTQRKGASPRLDAVGMTAQASRLALADTGAPADRLARVVDCLYVVNYFCWNYRRAPGMVADLLGLSPRKALYTAVGGNTPQLLVNQFARAIAAGECRAVLLAGGEALYTLRHAMKAGQSLPWPAQEPPEAIEGDNRDGLDRMEGDYGLYFPSFMYPLFETAIRASSGRTVAEHQRYMAGLYERFSAVAAGNPYAWGREPVPAREILEGPGNRYIGYPYTKRMNANIDVDMGAAVVMTSEAVADELGIDRALRVYPLGGAEFNNVWYVAHRPRLDDSPAMAEVSRLALAQAGLSLKDMNLFDLYSCFPCAVEMAMKAMGIGDDDPRPLTATGGLAYFGGPGNNFTMHAIASVVERIRQDRSLKALVNGNGWYNTKHAVGIYGDRPDGNTWGPRDDIPLQEAIDATALPPPVEKASGELTVEAYVIRHDREGRPESGTVVGRLADGRRTLAHIRASEEGLRSLEAEELVGRTGSVAYDEGEGRNRVLFEGI